MKQLLALLDNAKEFAQMPRTQSIDNKVFEQITHSVETQLDPVKQGLDIPTKPNLTVSYDSRRLAMSSHTPHFTDASTIDKLKTETIAVNGFCFDLNFTDNDEVDGAKNIDIKQSSLHAPSYVYMTDENHVKTLFSVVSNEYQDKFVEYLNDNSELSFSVE